MHVDVSKLNTPKEREVLSGNCLRFLFSGVTTTVGTLCALLELNPSCYLFLSKGIAYISLFYFKFFAHCQLLTLPFF